MTTTKLTSTQTAALAYIKSNGWMWVGQQGLGTLPNGAKALLAKGLVEVAEYADEWGNEGPAYVVPTPKVDFSNCKTCGSVFTTCAC